VFFPRGYLVLEAADEQQAAFVWHQMRGEIGLIIVDASPSQIFSWGRWHQRTPKLFIVHDPADAQLDTAPSDAGMAYVTKPFAAEEIALQVRLVLDSRKQQKRVLIVDMMNCCDARSSRALSQVVMRSHRHQTAEKYSITLETDPILTER
jgi:DNA-binding response OmpR family regulator